MKNYLSYSEALMDLPMLKFDLGMSQNDIKSQFEDNVLVYSDSLNKYQWVNKSCYKILNSHEELL